MIVAKREGQENDEKKVGREREIEIDRQTD